MSILSTALLRPQTYVGAAREAAGALQCVASFHRGLGDATWVPGQPSGDVTHDTPIVLVHGYGHNRSGWLVLERKLRGAGFTSVHALNYNASGARGVGHLAEVVAHRVKEIRDTTGADKVHLVGHSLGGVLLRWYVQELGGDDVVHTAITIATPHAGTMTAWAGPGPTARDLRCGSDVMKRLAAGARPMDTRWVALYTNLDVFIQPGASAMLREPALDATNVLVKDHGHLSIMVSSTVARLVTTELEAALLSSGARAGTILPFARRGAPDLSPGARAAEVG